MIRLSDVLKSSTLGNYEAPQKQGAYKLLLPSSLDDLSELVVDDSQRYALESPASRRALLQLDDVLLPAKGGRYAATLVTQQLVGHVASSGFFILRTRPELAPAYLVAYLNHPQTQRRLRVFTHASTTVPVLNKASLLDTAINLPPLPLQQQLGSLYQLWLREQQLTRGLVQQKDLRYQQAFQDAVETATGSFLTVS